MYVAYQEINKKTKRSISFFLLVETVLVKTVPKPGLCDVTKGVDITLMTTLNVCFFILTMEGPINVKKD